MNYEKHTWVDNETITAAKLNNIEDGISEIASSGSGYDGELYIHSSGGDLIVDRISGTFADIAAKLEDNIPPNILVRVWTDTHRAITNAVAVYGVYFEASVPVITFMVQVPTIHDGASSFYVYSYLYWDAEDEVYFGGDN